MKRFNLLSGFIKKHIDLICLFLMVSPCIVLPVVLMFFAYAVLWFTPVLLISCLGIYVDYRIDQKESAAFAFRMKEVDDYINRKKEEERQREIAMWTKFYEMVSKF